ncbi:MAG: response regulator receiver protein [Acidobacteriales bacterium]|nr:response regulator receiver protein [Terriglobales bacterium]
MPKMLGHILVVDDEPTVVYTLKAILEHVGYEASDAADMEQAHAVLRTQRVDAMICDLALKGDISGDEVIRQVRELQPDLPCVLLTGYAEPELVDSLENQGIPVLFKPVEMGRLLPLLRMMVGEKAA